MAFGDFTVARTSVKRVLNASGVLASVAANTPALEFNADGSYRGTLVEPAATNLLLRSEEFDDAYWSKNASAVVTANTDVAPDGNTTADTLTPIASEFSGVFRTITTAAGAHTMSVYARVASGTKLFRFFRFNGADGTVASPNFTITTTWQRFTWTTSPTASATWYIVNAAADTTPYFIWGAQLETGAVATSYIPTVASTETRTADSVTFTGASSLIGQTEGTLYVEAIIPSAPTGIFLAIGDGTANNRILFQFTNTTTLYATIRVAGANNDYQVTIPTVPASGGLYKLALGYNLNDYAFAVNGSTISPSTSARLVPACSVVYLGQSAASANQLGGHVRAVALYPTRLANATLATLTTL